MLNTRYFKPTFGSFQ